jgi:hypothetical protein
MTVGRPKGMTYTPEMERAYQMIRTWQRVFEAMWSGDHQTVNGHSLDEYMSQNPELFKP